MMEANSIALLRGSGPSVGRPRILTVPSCSRSAPTEMERSVISRVINPRRRRQHGRVDAACDHWHRGEGRMQYNAEVDEPEPTPVPTVPPGSVRFFCGTTDQLTRLSTS